MWSMSNFLHTHLAYIQVCFHLLLCILSFYNFCRFCLFLLDVDISFFFKRLFESRLKLSLQFGSYSLFYLENDSFSAFSDVCKKTVQTGLLE